MNYPVFKKETQVQVLILTEYAKMSAPNLWGKNYDYFQAHNYTFSMITKFIADMKALCKDEIQNSIDAGNENRAKEIRIFLDYFMADKRSHVRLQLDANGRSIIAKLMIRAILP